MKKATKKQMVDFIAKLLGESKRKQLNSMTKERLANVIVQSGKADLFNQYIEECEWLDMIYQEDDRTFSK